MIVNDSNNSIKYSATSFGVHKPSHSGVFKIMSQGWIKDHCGTARPLLRELGPQYPRLIYLYM